MASGETISKECVFSPFCSFTVSVLFRMFSSPFYYISCSNSENSAIKSFAIKREQFNVLVNISRNCLLMTREHFKTFFIILHNLSINHARYTMTIVTLATSLFIAITIYLNHLLLESLAIQS